MIGGFTAPVRVADRECPAADQRLSQSVRAFVTAGAGFLLAVLWFDLMFDVQMLAHRSGEAPERVLGSIAAYYGRVTTSARPMNRLVAAAMLATIAAVVIELADGDYAAWVRWSSLALVLVPVLLAGAHTVPSAVRLGTRSDPPARQSELARILLREHMLCFCAVAALIGVQLGAA